MKSIELKLEPEALEKLQNACNEVAVLNPLLKFDPRSLISLTIELAPLDELVEKVLLFEDKRLRRQLGDIKRLRKEQKAPEETPAKAN